MWEPRYDREGLPFTDDEPSVLTPRGELEAERRFLMGFSPGASSKQRRAARNFVSCLVVLVALFVVGYLVTLIVGAL
jgi:hypothetical protein